MQLIGYEKNSAIYKNCLNDYEIYVCIYIKCCRGKSIELKNSF